MCIDYFEKTYAVSSDFFHAVDEIQLELNGVLNSFIAVEASHSENILTDETYDKAVFGIRVAFTDVIKRLHDTVSNTAHFPCVMVQEATK